MDAVWSRDGKTIYYWEGDDLRAASLRVGPRFEVTTRRTVLTDPAYTRSCCHPNFDVFSDGSFIISRRESTGQSGGLVLVTNWFEELRASGR